MVGDSASWGYEQDRLADERKHKKICAQRKRKANGAVLNDV